MRAFYTLGRMGLSCAEPNLPRWLCSPFWAILRPRAVGSAKQRFADKETSMMNSTPLVHSLSSFVALVHRYPGRVFGILLAINALAYSLTMHYWIPVDAVVLQDQGAAFLDWRTTGESMLYQNNHYFLKTGILYLVPVLLESSYRFFDSMAGPRLLNILGLTLTGLMVWRWSLLRFRKVWISCIAACAVLFEPILTVCLRGGERVDYIAFALLFTSFWMLEKCRQASCEKCRNRWLAGCGFFFVMAGFTWTTAYTSGPFLAVYALDMAIEQRWTWRIYVRRILSGLSGVLAAYILFTMPLWSHFSQSIDDSVASCKFAANPIHDEIDLLVETGFPAMITLAKRSPVIFLIPLFAFLFPWKRTANAVTMPPQMESGSTISVKSRPALPANDSVLVKDDSATVSRENRPHSVWSIGISWIAERKKTSLYAAALLLILAVMSRTLFYESRILYLLPMMIFLLCQLLVEIAHIRYKWIVWVCLLIVIVPTLYNGFRVLGYTISTLADHSNCDMDRLCREFEPTIPRGSCVATHVWHLYPPARASGWHLYSSTYFDSTAILRNPDVEYAIWMPGYQNKSEQFYSGLKTNGFQYVTTIEYPYHKPHGLAKLYRTGARYCGYYEIWRRPKGEDPSSGNAAIGR